MNDIRTNDTRTMVMTLLNQYRENQRRMDLLHYELEHPTTVSEDEMIEALTFGHTDHTGTSAKRISDKTHFAALNYQAKAKKANEEALSEILLELSKLEKQQNRLLYYISLMEERYAEVIRMTYVSGMDNDQIASKLGVSVRTVSNRRAKAIDLLCDMFAFTARVQLNGTSS